MSESNVITKDDLVRDLRNLGLAAGDLLNVKVSLKSIGWIEGGANTLIDALLDVVGENGTIISDSFVSTYPLPLSEENAKKISTPETPSYAGALANAMVQHPKAFRSPHPIQKFVGIGKDAKELTQSHDINSPAYELLGIMAEKGGKNLKIGSDVKVPGVGTTHVAIERLGIKRERPKAGVNYLSKDGSVKLYEHYWTGACSDAWLKFYPSYYEIGAILSEGNVGNAPAKVSSMKKTLEWELAHIGENPSSLSCGRLACRICHMEWEFSKGNAFTYRIVVFLERIRRRLFGRK
jgi:aminoglycoside 3-N-acetyltransferase